MSERVDLYDSTYSTFASDARARVRAETFGTDIGQNSWTTAEEIARFARALDLRSGRRLLEVACGSGGPAVHLAQTTGCAVDGVDVNASGIATAIEAADRVGVSARVRFQCADACAPLPFEDETFDAVMCIDAMNHLPDRGGVLSEWRRVLRAGGRALFTDPVVITGMITSEEIALRSSIGAFVFAPPGVNERMIEQAGLGLVGVEDATENAALLGDRWRRARDRYRDELIRIEGPERYEGLQRFFACVHRLADERRLSRTVYIAEKTGR